MINRGGKILDRVEGHCDMARVGDPGYVFAIHLPSGRFAVGLVTHRELQGISVIWIAKPTFESKPTLNDAASIAEWRWATTTPVAGGVRQKLFLPVGTIDIPVSLRDTPVMRTWALDGNGWKKIRVEEDFRNTRTLGKTDDSTLSIYSVLSSTTLLERIDSGWSPSDDWVIS